MDRVIERFTYRHDGDLALCEHEGVAYQRDMTRRIRYTDDYLFKFEAYDPAVVAAVNSGRVSMLRRHLAKGATVLDIGAGDGAFVRAARFAGFDALGFEVIERAADRLRSSGHWSDGNPAGFDAVTLWDTLEHMEDPGAVLDSIPGILFVSLPVFADVRAVRESKHYRPGEHLYYWTASGFVEWARRYGFHLVESSSHETDAGRESIGAFAFSQQRAVSGA